MRWLDSHPVAGFLGASFALCAAVFALLVVIGQQSAEASPAVRSLTATEQQWVVECAKYPNAYKTPYKLVHDCAERARNLGSRGWL